MADTASPGRKSFWTTLPGVLTGVAGLIVAVTGMITALQSAGVIGGSDGETASAAPGAAGLPIEGTWRAEVVYDFGAAHTETFKLRILGNEVHGSASFLGVDRGILEGRLEGDQLAFVTRTEEIAGDEKRMATHRYTGIVSAEEIRFIMLTEGGFSGSVPVEFTAIRKAF